MLKGLGKLLNGSGTTLAQKASNIFKKNKPVLDIWIEQAYRANLGAWEGSPNLADGIELTPLVGNVTVTGDTVRLTAVENTAWNKVELRVPITWGKAYFVSIAITGVASGAQSYVSTTNGGGTNTEGYPQIPGYKNSPEYLTGILYPVQSGAERLDFEIFVRRNHGAANIGDWIEFSRSSIQVREVDLSRFQIFQDSAGTMPVTAMGQPIGLILDPSKGLERGPELIGSPIGPWVLAGGVTHVGGSTFSFSNVTSGSAAFTSFDLPTTPGPFFRIVFEITAVSAGSAGIRLASNGQSAQKYSKVGTYSVLLPVGTADAANRNVVFDVSGFTGTARLVSIRELPGHHAVQPSNTASRPVVSRRVNLMVSTNNFSASAWAKQGVTVLSAVESGADKIIATTASETYKGVSTSGSSVSTTADSRATVRFLAKPSGYSVAAFVAYGNGGRVAFDLANNTATTYGGQNMVASVVDGGDGFKVCTVTFDTLLGGEVRVGPRPTVSDGSQAFSGDGSSGILLKEFDLRLTQDTINLPPYQRVTSATDYDEVGFPAFALADGLDDWLETAAIDLTGTDAVTVLAGVMKTNDAAAAMVLETSANSDTNTGSIALIAPGSTPASQRYGFGTRGSAALVTPYTAASAYSAPHKALMTGLGKISTDTAILRVNGIEVATSSADQGTGNYGLHKLYFLRRGGSSLPFKGRFYGATLFPVLIPTKSLSILERLYLKRLNLP